MAVTTTELKRLQEQIKKLRLENARLRRKLEGDNAKTTIRAIPSSRRRSALVIPPQALDSSTRARLLRTLTQRMKQNPLPINAKRFTREELHERR